MGNVNSFITEIIGIEKPWKVESVTFDGVDTVDIELGYIRSLRPKAPGCPECGSEETSYYDMVDKTWRHTDMCDQICFIHGKVPRIRCKACGKVSRVKAPWAADTINNYTDSFEAKVVRLSKAMPVTDVCKEMRLDDSTVWTILDRHVDACMSRQDLSEVHTYYVDEKAIRKGHVYLSSFLDQDHNVIYVGKDNTIETVTGFRVHLESHRGSPLNIKHISMDMGAGYISGAKLNFPNAKVTFDRFHVAEHATEAVNDVRKREYARLVDEQEKGMLKGQRYLFLKNYKNLDEEGQTKVRSLVSSFPDLGVVYTFKESLRRAWEYERKYDAFLFLQRWIGEAKETGIPELLKLVGLVESHLDGILNWYESRISNGVMEGFNSVLQAFKGRARGYRSFERYRTMIYLRCSGLC
jgi:transposase